MPSSVEPLFLSSSPDKIVFSWAGFAGNLAFVGWGAYWLVADYDAARVAWYHLVPAIVAGLFLLDWFSGLVHWTYDTWFDEHIPGFQRSVSIAREHHVLPYHIVGYAFRDHVSYSSWPAFAFVAPIGLLLSVCAAPTPAVYVGVLLTTGICFGMLFGSHCHLLGHRPARSRVIRFLQRSHLLVSPAYHRLHHDGGHDTRYAVVNGWSNVVCDRIGFWRGLERVIQALTSAEPRRSDREWMARYARRRGAVGEAASGRV